MKTFLFFLSVHKTISFKEPIYENHEKYIIFETQKYSPKKVLVNLWCKKIKQGYWSNLYFHEHPLVLEAPRLIDSMGLPQHLSGCITQIPM